VKTVTLADFRPSRRADGQAWTKAKIEGAATANAKSWDLVAEVTLDPIDVDPLAPALRSFTVTTAFAWLRVVFIDKAGGEDLEVLVSTSQHSFRPTVDEVAGILSARTYDTGGDGLAGGEQLGEFTEDTRPTAEQVEGRITKACTDVERATGSIPGEMIGDTRPIAAMRAASEVERSWEPEETEAGRTIYQTLRMTFESDLATLVGNLRLWTLANRGME
jgi:hypothetical protein